jgi:uncharacterized protein DUF5675
MKLWDSFGDALSVGLKKIFSLTSLSFRQTGYEKRMNNPLDSMILNRTDFTDKSTIGDLFLDGNWQCFTLELPCRNPNGGKICIPEGKYELLMQWSTRFGMDTPHLQNVPDRTFIEIHPGNKPEDTEGCILLGQSKDVDWVSNSRAAYQALIPFLDEKLKAGKFYISITGGEPKSS